MAAAVLSNVQVHGSLLVRATAPLGHMQAAACMPAPVTAPPPPPTQPAYSQTRWVVNLAACAADHLPGGIDRLQAELPNCTIAG